LDFNAPQLPLGLLLLLLLRGSLLVLILKVFLSPSKKENLILSFPKGFFSLPTFPKFNILLVKRIMLCLLLLG